MGFFNEFPTPQEQLENGRISYAFALKLTRLAYLVSKRKLIEFYLPVLVLVLVVVAGSKFLFSEGRGPTHYIGIPIMVFAFYSWFAVKFYWADKGVAYLGWVALMFGPKTKNTVLAQFLAGERYNLLQAAKAEGEYAGSVYVRGFGVDRDS
ncbi:conserved hypothetical protein [Pseudomonas veronii]|uniref:hypothetical protein n=1 Tax=Pseudomonas veronii TaxID=76761 RepID=UPI00175FA900|nr:hypothetical protein [Pseudomonas veronii]CAD0264199.1 conserved hypothetical protein [Pseudomonas veronii]